ncbi:major facilitator superfamily domain-containing protein [Xylaria scruposa]|nr:major facilitator superfamily domain-containing protein [Xylaria scruposa]
MRMFRFSMEGEAAPLLEQRQPTSDRNQSNWKLFSILNVWSGFSPSFKYCIALELLCELAVMIITVPMVSVLEQAVCFRYYHGDITNPELCKVLPIQRTLAEVRGWTGFFETLAAIFVALPIGRIADYRGQRGIFMVLIAGMLMNLTWTLVVVTNPILPIKLVWVSPVFLLFGGGRYAAEMLLAAMISKACNEETRTRGLYHFYSCFIFSELIGPQIASVAADVSIWLPFFISYSFLLLAFPLLAVMPEDHLVSEPTSIASEGSEGVLETHVLPERRDILYTVLQASVSQYHLLKFIFSNRNMRLAAVIFLIGTFRGISLRALIQYTSFRFGWKLSRTNALISEVALVNLFLFFLIMPTTISVVRKYLKPAIQALNLGIVQASLSLLLTGSVLIAFATSSILLISATMVYALGFGARSTLLSLITSWIDPKRAGTLYSAVFLIEQIGMLVGEPLIQNLLGISVGLRDPWKGLPFICTGLFYVASLICAFLMKLQPT